MRTRIIVFALFAMLLSKARAQSVSIFTPQGGPIAIPSTEGFLTTRDLLGKNIFLVFGFTTCPDICPLTLHNLKEVAAALTKEERDHFRFLFVSIDPEMDSMERLKALKSVYGPQFIGATDSKERLSSLARQFGAFFRVFKTKGGKRIVSHTDSIFHINREGEWVGTLPFGSSKQTFLEELKKSKKVSTDFFEGAVTAQLIGENDTCDLSKKECEIQTKQGTFKLSMGPKPIRAEKEFWITVKVNPKSLVPTEIDFEGQLINMGYLRPELAQKSSGEYETKFTLPICELDKMDWIVKLFLKDPEGRIQVLRYRLTTTD